MSQDITVLQTPTDAIEGTGDFSYSMAISVGGPGGNTDVTITPNHNFDEISPRSVFEISFRSYKSQPEINLLRIF